MSRLLACAVVILLFAPFLPAQSYPAAEFYAGFSLQNNEYGTDRRNAPGFQSSFGYNLTRNLRLGGEFGGQFHGTDLYVFDRRMSVSNYQLLFGPEFAFRNRSSVTPFVRVMAGYTTRRFKVPTGVFSCTGFGSCTEEKATVLSDSGFGAAFGGGIDIDVGRYFAVRAVQFDYLRTKLNRNEPEFLVDTSLFPTLREWQNNYRFSVGLVFRLGERGDGRRR